MVCGLFRTYHIDHVEALVLYKLWVRVLEKEKKFGNFLKELRAPSQGVCPTGILFNTLTGVPGFSLDT